MTAWNDPDSTVVFLADDDFRHLKRASAPRPRRRAGRVIEWHFESVVVSLTEDEITEIVRPEEERPVREDRPRGPETEPVDEPDARRRAVRLKLSRVTMKVLRERAGLDETRLQARADVLTRIVLRRLRPR